MKKLTFEVLRNDSKTASESLQAYMVRYEENGKTREFIVPEYTSALSEAERSIMKHLHELLKTSM